MKSFKSKVAVITGAASGIGLGLAERCAKEGMKVVLADIEKGALSKAEKNIKDMGVDTLAIRTDVSKADDVKNLSQKTLETFGMIHLLFNNAGVYAGRSIWESTLADWHWTLSVDLWGIIHGVYFFVPIMLKQNTECHIVNTASAAGLFTSIYNGVYAVSKHAVVALSETLYREMEQVSHKIGVSVLCPGYVKTNMINSKRNRPIELRNKPEEEINMATRSFQDVLKTKVDENYMPPQQVADIVFSSIREKNFYILPNAGPFMPRIQARMEDILQQRNPTNPFDFK